LTQTRSECKAEIDLFGKTIGSLSPADATTGLQAIYNDCSNKILGFLVEAVSVIGQSIGSDPNELLDIATGITNLPVPMPKQCIANDLILMFTQMVEADTEFTDKVNSLVPNTI
jgi:hypothetical protein